MRRILATVLMCIGIACLLAPTCFADEIYFLSERLDLNTSSGGSKVYEATVRNKAGGDWTTGASECADTVFGDVYGKWVGFFNMNDDTKTTNIEVWGAAALTKGANLYDIVKLGECTDDGRSGTNVTYGKYVAYEVSDLLSADDIDACLADTACSDKHGRTLKKITGFKTGFGSNCTAGNKDCCRYAVGDQTCFIAKTKGGGFAFYDGVSSAGPVMKNKSHAGVHACLRGLNSLHSCTRSAATNPCQDAKGSNFCTACQAVKDSATCYSKTTAGYTLLQDLFDAGRSPSVSPACAGTGTDPYNCACAAGDCAPCPGGTYDSGSDSCI